MPVLSSRLGALIGPAVVAGVLLLALAQPLRAGTLEGQVVGPDGSPRPNVRIDLFGPQKRVTVTDQDGRFTVKAAGGTYRIRFSKHPRQTEQRASIPKSGKTERRFRVDW